MTLYSALEVTLCYLWHSTNRLFYIILITYLMTFHYTFTAESDGERILEIGQHLAKLWARVGSGDLFFLTHSAWARVTHCIYVCCLFFPFYCFFLSCSGFLLRIYILRRVICVCLPIVCTLYICRTVLQQIKRFRYYMAVKRLNIVKSATQLTLTLFRHQMAQTTTT